MTSTQPSTTRVYDVSHASTSRLTEKPLLKQTNGPQEPGSPTSPKGRHVSHASAASDLEVAPSSSPECARGVTRRRSATEFVMDTTTENDKIGCPGCHPNKKRTNSPQNQPQRTQHTETRGCPGCPGCGFNQPGHQNGRQNVSTALFAGVSRLSRLGSNLSHVHTHTCAHPHVTHVIDVPNSRDSRDTLTQSVLFGRFTGSTEVEGVPAGFTPSRDTRDTRLAVTGGVLNG